MNLIQESALAFATALSFCLVIYAKYKIDNRQMNRAKRLDRRIGLAAAAFLCGIALGRYALPNPQKQPLARSQSVKASARERGSTSLAQASSNRLDGNIESLASDSTGLDVISRLKQSITAGGDGALYDAFNSAAGAINKNNVHDLLALDELNTRSVVARSVPADGKR